MISALLLDYICAFLLFIINTSTFLYSALLCFLQYCKTADSLPRKLLRLQATQSALLKQQNNISHRLADIDAAITYLHQSSQQSQPNIL
jgi:hypothetical protein